MHRVACDRLLDLRQRRFRVTHEQIAYMLAAPEFILEQFDGAPNRMPFELQTKFQTQHQASRYLRQNWNRIERMARDCLARECFEDGRINLVMI